MADLSAVEAARELGVDASRVRQMLRAGTLPGRRLGRDWAVPADAVAAASAHQVGPGRPLAARRAWGVLDLLDGGTAAWLHPVARSQARAQARAMAGKDAAAWARALRGREDRLAMTGHRAAIARLLGDDDVWAAGPAVASSIGADLVVVDAVPEVYVPSERWAHLARSLRLSPSHGQPDVWVRVPRQVWPFGPAGPGKASLAASLLDGEWRAARAGAEILDRLVMQADWAVRGGR